MYYEAGDKTGRLHARAKREPKTTKNIMGIRRQDGSLDLLTEAITTHFHSYYIKLYNLPTQHRPPTMTDDRAQAIQDYLNKSGLPKLTEADTSPLEEPITPLEIHQAFKDLKSIHLHLIQNICKHINRPADKGLELSF